MVDTTGLPLHSIPHKVVQGMEVRAVWRPNVLGPKSLEPQLVLNLPLGGVRSISLDVILSPATVPNAIGLVKSWKHLVCQQVLVLGAVDSALCPKWWKHLTIGPHSAQHHG